VVRQFTHELSVRTRGKGLYRFTHEVETWLAGCSIGTGLLTVFIRHTSASLTIQENADPDVLLDLNDAYERLAPEDSRLYRHDTEGEDDMPAHIRATLSGAQLTIPVIRGRLALGTWQGLYVFEHRQARQSRSVVLHLIGE
jgi:secondary thiamine-phosphate synthase enzyme